MLKEAYVLLEKEIEKCLDQVADDAALTIYAREKQRHSLQVAGAGNYLLKHISWFQNKSADFIEKVKTAVLLHDIARFQEIALLKQKKHIDHGVVGAEMLQKMPLFSDIRIWLPIRHHGHLIEELYADADYQNIADTKLQNEVKQICFVVRDADKIANLHMLVNEPDIRPLFLGKEKFDAAIDGKISQITKQTAFDGKTIPRDFAATPADRMAGFLSWYTDINYQSSVDFCAVLGVTDGMIKLFADYCSDEVFKSSYIMYIKNFIKTHQYLI